MRQSNKSPSAFQSSYWQRQWQSPDHPDISLFIGFAALPSSFPLPPCFDFSFDKVPLFHLQWFGQMEDALHPMSSQLWQRSTVSNWSRTQVHGRTTVQCEGSIKINHECAEYFLFLLFLSRVRFCVL